MPDDIGLTAFIVAMLKAPVSALATADPAKLAAKYRIPPQTAAFYISQWKARA